MQFGFSRKSSYVSKNIHTTCQKYLPGKTYNYNKKLFAEYHMPLFGLVIPPYMRTRKKKITNPPDKSGINLFSPAVRFPVLSTSELSRSFGAKNRTRAVFVDFKRTFFGRFLTNCFFMLLQRLTFFTLHKTFLRAQFWLTKTRTCCFWLGAINS
eukprot:GEMP01112506.1.p1 GENE.GEMP01112506.1~~GEMP01112506.1.p1  ORF type:complete len:154 (-),score=3.48 GEMP01112506.1:186-647(-)